MARLKNSKTGVVVNTSDAVAERLDGYEPVKAEKKSTSKSSSSDTDK